MINSSNQRLCSPSSLPPSLPIADRTRIYEGEQLVEQSEGVTFARIENGRVEYNVVSGEYVFRVVETYEKEASS